MCIRDREVPAAAPTEEDTAAPEPPPVQPVTREKAQRESGRRKRQDEMCIRDRFSISELMEEIPLIALLCGLETSCLITVPTPSGLKVFFIIMQFLYLAGQHRRVRSDSDRHTHPLIFTTRHDT